MENASCKASFTKSLLSYHPMMRRLLIWGTIVFWTQGCAIDPIPFPPIQYKPMVSSDGFEPAEVLDAREILPPDLRKSEYHTVLDEVTPFRLTNRFSISSPFGQCVAYGEDMLRMRIQEIQILAKVEDMNRYSAMAEGAGRAVLSPFVFIKNLLIDPVHTLIGIPKGLWRIATRMQEMATGERGALEEDATKELIGFSSVKRYIAHQLGVDVYSSNRVLQSKLDRLSWGAYTGDAGVKLMTIPIGGPAGAVFAGTSLSATVNELLRDYTPEDLRRMNREKLQAMEIDGELIETFLSHPWYSPRHETILVQALTEMKEVKNRGGFLQAALAAEFEEDALFFQRLSEMMASYHQSMKFLLEIIVIHDRFVIGYTWDHALVAMVPVGRLPWSREVAAATEAVMTWKSQDHPVERIELWTLGKLTPLAHQQLLAKGLNIYEQATEEMRWASFSNQQNQFLASLPAAP